MRFPDSTPLPILSGRATDAALEDVDKIAAAGKSAYVGNGGDGQIRFEQLL